jgi:voltage-gated potassium channel
MVGSARHTVWHYLEKGRERSAGPRAARIVVIVAILASVAAVFASTMHGLDPAAAATIAVVRAAAAILFALEYAMRLWTAPEFDPVAAPWRARLGYAWSFLGVIDLLSFLPWLAGQAGAMPPDWAAVASLLALCKLARYAPALTLVGAVIRAEARPLLAALLVMLVLLVLVSGLMYLIERGAQPSHFSSIPATLWWGIVTIASVGYGDMVPVTPAGKVIGGVVMILGLAAFAVPAGILATGFASEIRKRDFLVTWQAVARVPLFAALDASRVAAITRLLKPQIIPADTVVVRKGEPADGMYFIMSGEVEVEVEPAPVRLAAGHYFGEIALLRDITRTATVRTVAETRLLGLEARDFRRLMDENPMLREAVEQVADARLSERSDEAGE